MKDRDREEDREREHRDRDYEQNGANGDDRKGKFVIYHLPSTITDMPLRA